MGPLSEQTDVENDRLQPGSGAGVFEVETVEVSIFFASRNVTAENTETAEQRSKSKNSACSADSAVKQISCVGAEIAAPEKRATEDTESTEKRNK